MAFFKFRKGGDEQPTPAVAPESVEAMRKRARHRLMGAALLVLVGVIGFPLLFDSQPRPISLDISIEIPDKNQVKPLGNLPVAAPEAQTSGAVQTEAAAVPMAPASLPVAVRSGNVTPMPARLELKAPEKAASSVATTERVDDGSRAQALLDGKEVSSKTATVDARFVVQVGAFADAVKAHEARMKLEHAGLKTYTQVVEPKEGRRVRVRVGPFDSKLEADKVAEKIRKLELPAAILEL
jgi:DedD protein